MSETFNSFLQRWSAGMRKDIGAELDERVKRADDAAIRRLMGSQQFKAALKASSTGSSAAFDSAIAEGVERTAYNNKRVIDSATAAYAERFKARI